MGWMLGLAWLGVVLVGVLLGFSCGFVSFSFGFCLVFVWVLFGFLWFILVLFGIVLFPWVSFGVRWFRFVLFGFVCLLVLGLICQIR